MKKTITVFSVGYFLKAKSIITILCIGLISLFSVTAKAQSPYCGAAHTLTVSCATYGMYIGQVTLKQGSNTIYNKPNDNCNNTSPPNYTLISSTPSFSLAGGGDYNLYVTSNGTNQVHLGVWIDLNCDNDFSDAGEFIKTMQMGASGNFDFSLPKFDSLWIEMFLCVFFLFVLHLQLPKHNVSNES